MRENTWEWIWLTAVFIVGLVVGVGLGKVTGRSLALDPGVSVSMVGNAFQLNGVLRDGVTLSCMMTPASVAGPSGVSKASEIVKEAVLSPKPFDYPLQVCIPGYHEELGYNKELGEGQQIVCVADRLEPQEGARQMAEKVEDQDEELISCLVKCDLISDGQPHDEWHLYPLRLLFRAGSTIADGWVATYSQECIRERVIAFCDNRRKSTTAP